MKHAPAIFTCIAVFVIGVSTQTAWLNAEHETNDYYLEETK